MQKLKPLFILIFVLFVVTLGAKVARKNRLAVVKHTIIADTASDNSSVGFRAHIYDIYREAGLASYKLDSNVFFKAMVGYYNLEGEGKLNQRKNIISVVDFSKPSTEKRLWVIDLDQNKVLFNSLVAHGKNSGENIAKKFSNTSESNMSSLGFYVTDQTYIGKHGLSLFINGMDKGYNANARNRSVVVHGASYVSESFINMFGRLGRSQGCPALPEDIAPEIIKTIADGTTLFLYYPDKKYEATTQYYDLTNAREVYDSSQHILQASN
jgi:hypothetical protein